MSGKPPIDLIKKILIGYNKEILASRESPAAKSLYEQGHDDGIANIKPSSQHNSYLLAWTKARRFQFGLATGSFGVCNVDYSKLKTTESLDGFWDGLNLVDPITAKVVGYQSLNSDSNPIIVETDRTLRNPEYKRGYEAGLRFLGGLVQSSPYLELEPLAEGYGYQDLLSALDIATYDLKQEKIEGHQKDPLQDNTTASVFAHYLNRVGAEKVLNALRFSFTRGNEMLGEMDLPLPPALPNETIVTAYQKVYSPTISPLPSPRNPVEGPDEEINLESLSSKPVKRPITRSRPSLRDAMGTARSIELTVRPQREKQIVEDLSLSIPPEGYPSRESEDDEKGWEKFEVDFDVNRMFNHLTLRYSN